MLSLEVVGIISLLSGVIIAVVNSLLVRRKTKAEIEKLQAEAEKFRVETQRIRIDMGEASDFQLTPSEEKISFPRTVEIQGGIRPIGTKFVTFPFAFPATPIVLISPVSKKPVIHTLSDVSTTGFTVYIWGEQGESVSDVSFNWIAYLHK